MNHHDYNNVLSVIDLLAGSERAFLAAEGVVSDCAVPASEQYIYSYAFPLQVLD